MHVISDDSTVADTIRYDTPSIGSDTDPIIVRSLKPTANPKTETVTALIDGKNRSQF